MQKSISVEEFIAKNGHWREILETLRPVLLSTGLEETVKWGVPVYTLNGKNVVGMTAFKDFAALWFFQGALLEDRSAVLINAQEGKTRAQRQWRFRSIEDLDAGLVKDYVTEAVDNQQQRRAVKRAPKKSLDLPPELSAALSRNPRLKRQFEKLAPYKQRDYAEYVSTAKRNDTRQRRLAKIIPMIEQRMGLNDRYR
jgi:uncharacterized protein YdeI (YjbR/CyaY-like superfamily)